MKASELIKQLQDLVNEHGYRAWTAKYTDNVESEFYYKADPPGKGSGIFVY